MAETLWRDIVYTEALQSDGYVVDYAVCTTYSLDLQTLLSVPFMLSTMAELSADVMPSEHLIMEAINRSSEKFAVFCNAGCIAVPKIKSKLYPFLERSVVQVTLPARNNAFVNFHPKVWVIKETSPQTKKKQIKVVVLSRNLTCSNDLDVVCLMAGEIGQQPASKEAQRKHKPLVDFLSWLVSNQQCGQTVTNNVNAICKDINNIERFDLSGSDFDDYDFFPMGIPEHNGYEECLEKDILSHAAEMVIISPFVDEATLQRMVRQGSKAKKTLITRHSSVTQSIIDKFPNGGVYVPKDGLIDNEDWKNTVDLHEKVYFVRRSQGNLSYNHLYLGSTNATTNGFNRNVEFLIHLKFAPHRTSYDKFLSELINDEKDCMFEQVTSVLEDNKEKDSVQDELDLRRAIAAIIKARIATTDNGYSVTIQCDESKLPETGATLCPLGCEGKEQALADEMTFSDMPLETLTEFYVIKIWKLEKVIKIPTIGMPEEEREKAVFRSLINSKKKFVNYLDFLFTQEADQYILESQPITEQMSTDKSRTASQPVSTSLYEKMMKAAYTDPDLFASVDKVLELADERHIPSHFTEMYNTFKDALKQIKR